MSTSRPFAYNPSQTNIPGVNLFGYLSVGTIGSGQITGLTTWNGPDEDLGYVVAKTVPDNTQPTPILGVSASVGFYRSSTFSESSFLYTVNRGLSLNFSVANDASNYLLTNGYWTNYPTRSFKIRVLGDGGIFEADSCLETQLNTINNESLLSTASLVVTPNGYTEGLMYSVIPNQVGTNIFRYSEDFENAVWGKYNYTIVQNTTTAPNGTLTADTLRIGIDASSVRHRFWQSIALTGVITTSYYLKKAQHRWVQLNYVTSPDLNDWANFDLENGVIGNTGVGAVASIEDVGDGWYRCILEGVGGGSNTNCEIISTNNTNSGRYPAYQSSVAEDVCYVWGAQLVYGSTVTDYFPTSDRAIINGTLGDLTVTRATTGRRVNSSGLIEEMPYNLFQRSEEFENVIWTKNVVSITSNVINAPNGTLTADRLNEVATTNYHGIYQSTTFVVGRQYTYSIYVNKGNSSYCGLEAFYNSTNGAIAFFNLDTGVLLYEFSQGANYTITNSSITDEGNGWFKLQATFTFGHTTSYPGVSMASTQWVNGTSYSNTYLGNTSRFIYIWGAQIVEGTQAKNYIKTTNRLNIPRLDYTNSTCPSILLEQQRTNVCLQSENFTTSWAGSATVTANSTIAPDGTQTADTLIDSGTTGFGTKAQTFTITPNSPYVASFFIKKTTGALTSYPGIGLVFTGVAVRATYMAINTTTGAITYITASGSPVPSFRSLNVFDYGDYWRVSFLVVDNQSNTTLGYTFYPALTTDFINGNTAATGSAIFWGAQLELGYEATSYIPTTTATVTRNVDTIIKSGAQSLIGQTDGTIYCEFMVTDNKNWNSAIIILYGATTDDRITIRFRPSPLRPSGGHIEFFGRSGGVDTISIIGSGIIPTINQWHKICVKYNQTEQKFFYDGTLVGTRVGSYTQPGLLQNIGIGSGANTSNINIKNAAVWKTVITDTQAINLTTL